MSPLKTKEVAIYSEDPIWIQEKRLAQLKQVLDIFPNVVIKDTPLSIHGFHKIIGSTSFVKMDVELQSMLD